MQERYALRFESGERRGEIIPIPPSGLTLGRRPGNSVQILDASVSGKHAELTVAESGVTLRDTGSTNGTFLGSERISQHRLAHGDVVVLGKVRFFFIDATVDANPPASGELEIEGEVAAAGEGLRTISADQLARSSKRSAIFVLALALVAVGGGAAYWFLGRGTHTGAASARPAVKELAGNLLAAGYSFEGDLVGWESADDANSRFVVDPSAAFSGASGLRAVLSKDEFALERSAWVRTSAGSTLRVVGELSSDGAARGLLGIELDSSTGECTPIVAWAPAAGGSVSFEAVEFDVLVPPAYDKARALIAAHAEGSGGTVLADDVAMLAPAQSNAAAIKLGDVQWIGFGSPARAGLLAKTGRPLLVDLRVTANEPERFGDDAAALEAKARDDGFEIAIARSGASAKATRLSLLVAPASAAQGLATLGQGGYRTHQVQFERDQVDGLVFGGGLELVRLRFSAPVKLRGRPENNAFRIEADIGEQSSVSVQVDFQKDRLAGDDAAKRAREAERGGKLGESLAAWKELLDRAPFEEKLVKEADGARARLIQQGLDEVQKAKAAAESARFFRLVDLFRECRRNAEAIGAKYAGSEVETAARELSASIDQDLSGLERDLRSDERKRLEAIQLALEKSNSPKLAQRVKETLAAMPGGSK